MITFEIVGRKFKISILLPFVRIYSNIISDSSSKRWCKVSVENFDTGANGVERKAGTVKTSPMGE